MIKAQTGKRVMGRCLILCLLTAMASFLYFILEGHGAFTVVDDFNTQQIPFNIAMHRAMTTGGEWNWGLDLGTANLYAFGFYGLGGIYAWLLMLVPPQLVPYAVGWLYMLKYVVAGLTSFLWLRQFVKDENYAVIGALLYAFSGFQTTNLEFYHFHDVVSFFPLMLLGIDAVVRHGNDRGGVVGKSCLLFAGSVAINCLCNYYFFVEEVVFVVLYFLFRYFRPSAWRQCLRPLVLCLLYAVLGVALSAVLFLPSVNYILQNSRTDSKITLSAFFPDALTSLFLLKSYFFPGEAMNSISAVKKMNWDSTSAYLPLFGMTGVIAYLWCGQREWLTRLIRTLLVVSFVPLLSSGFLLFAESNQRWFFMMLLLFAAATILVLENRDTYRLTPALLLNAAMVAALYLLISYVKWDKKDEAVLVFHPAWFLCYTLVALAGSAILLVLTRVPPKHFLRLLTGSVSLLCIVTTGLTLHHYRTFDKPEQYQKRFYTALQLETIDDQYRYRGDNFFDGLISAEDVGGLSTFSSTTSLSVQELDRMFDYKSTNLAMPKTSIVGLAELLGGKYELTQDPANADKAIRTYSDGDAVSYVVEWNACPIGYAVSGFAAWEDIHDAPLEYRAALMLDTAVVDEDAVETLAVSSSFQQVTPEELQHTVDTLPADQLWDYVSGMTQKSRENAVQDFQRDGHGFSCNSTYSEDKLVYFSVPYDAGWQATVDGQPAEILRSCGMMLLAVPAGQHRIEFRYTTPWLGLGKAVSAGALGVFLLLLAVCVWRRRHSTSEKQLHAAK